MTRRRFALLATLTSLACWGDPEPSHVAPPTRPRAILILEPPSLRIGEIATLDLVVTTAPNFVPRPFAPPKQLNGFWILDAETLPVEVDGPRWIHRTRLRARARELGRFEWPATRIDVESPEGGLVALETEALAVEVRAELGNFGGREAPFGVLLHSDARNDTGGFATGAAAGALGSLLGVSLLATARRRTRHAVRNARAGDPAAESATHAVEGDLPWNVARTGMADVRNTALDSDPRRAAHLSSGLLRRYVSTRFGIDTDAFTTEELAQQTPPFRATTRWPVFVAIAADLDALRFPPAQLDGQARRLERERVAALIERIEAFVADTTPESATR